MVSQREDDPRLLDLLRHDPRASQAVAAVEFVQQVVEELKCVRQRAGLTQKALARRLGVTQGRVSQIESGLMDHAPSLEMVARYALACGHEASLVCSYPLVTAEEAVEPPEMAIVARAEVEPAA